MIDLYRRSLPDPPPILDRRVAHSSLHSPNVKRGVTDSRPCKARLELPHLRPDDDDPGSTRPCPCRQGGRGHLAKSHNSILLIINSPWSQAGSFTHGAVGCLPLGTPTGLPPHPKSRGSTNGTSLPPGPPSHGVVPRKRRSSSFSLLFLLRGFAQIRMCLSILRIAGPGSEAVVGAEWLPLSGARMELISQGSSVIDARFDVLVANIRHRGANHEQEGRLLRSKQLPSPREPAGDVHWRGL